MPRRKVDVKREIMKALTQKKELTWSELLKATKVSKGALSKYLNQLINYGLVETKIDESKRPPKTVYCLRKDVVYQKYKAMLYFEDSKPIGKYFQEIERKVKNIQNEEEKVELLKKFYKIILFLLLGDNVAFLMFMATPFILAADKQAETKRSKMTKEQISHLEAISKYFWMLRFESTIKPIFRFLASNLEYSKYLVEFVIDSYWIARLLEEKPGDLDRALKEFIHELERDIVIGTKSEKKVRKLLNSAGKRTQKKKG